MLDDETRSALNRAVQIRLQGEWASAMIQHIEALCQNHDAYPLRVLLSELRGIYATLAERHTIQRVKTILHTGGEYDS